MGFTRDGGLCRHGLYVYHLREDRRKRKCHHATGATPDDVSLRHLHAFKSAPQLSKDSDAVHSPHLPGGRAETRRRRQPVALWGNNRSRGSPGRHRLLPHHYSEEVQVGIGISCYFLRYVMFLSFFRYSHFYNPPLLEQPI